MALFQKSFFNKSETARIQNAITEAENMTSGEIRVFVEKNCPIEPYDRALFVFHHLELHKRVRKNSVLLYFAYGHKKFAVVGDEDIHKKVGVNFWNEVRDICIGYFKKEEYAEGLVRGIELAGEKMKAHFPHQAHDHDGEKKSDMIINGLDG
jgi:uncharacterized membrane protein